ncbi:MAG: helix-turn-helix transcriptional regulator [Streptomycetaceae bacterium]|nr:helix-turn-helix transcriptional regulator [Streptomycetaceae bacterium]
MGLWEINADTLASSRFVVSPYAEAMACWMALAVGSPTHPGERAWFDAHLTAYRERVAADPVTASLVDAAFGRSWIADFLTQVPGGAGKDGAAAFAEELARVRETPPEDVLADLAVSYGRPLPELLRDRTDLAERAADLVRWVWTETVQPSWEARRRLIEADMITRMGQLSQGGWAAALDDMRPGMRWLGEGRLQINTHDYPPREIAGAQLLFVPVTVRKGWVSWDAPRVYAIVYPCAGQLAEAALRRPTAAEPLGRLLGAARAGVLLLLDTPLSTTQLVALTGQALGSVGGHLKVLRDAGLVRRRRAGRSVLYYRTEVGTALVEAQG